jgi:hypothetical protein
MNNTEIWNNILNETEREYIFSDHSIKVFKPALMCEVLGTNNKIAHKILTRNGDSFYITGNWEKINVTK